MPTASTAMSRADRAPEHPGMRLRPIPGLAPGAHPPASDRSMLILQSTVAIVAALAAIALSAVR